MNLKFFSLASGSSGNCYYLGGDDYGILIDAGIGIRVILRTLKQYQIPIDKIVGLLITHDHADHIKTAGILGTKYAIPVYTTEMVHHGIYSSRYVFDKLYSTKKIIQKETPFFIRDFKITAFEVPHDSSDNVGYLIEYKSVRFAIATDVGHITDTITHYLKQATHLILESNYDEEMLQFGSYPLFLKERVSSPTGHLSNASAAEFLAQNYTPELKNVWLCHLSKENNHPELAFKTVDIRLFNEGIRVGKDLSLTVLKRNTPSEIFNLE